MASGEKGLVIDKIHEPTLVEQVGEETVGTRGVPKGHQILRERDLHRCSVEEHAWMPGEGELSFDEAGSDAIAGGARRVVLLDRNRQGQVGRSETHSDDVECSECRIFFHPSRSHGISPSSPLVAVRICRRPGLGQVVVQPNLILRCSGCVCFGVPGFEVSDGCP